MKRFLKHFMILLILVPAVLLTGTIIHFAVTYEVVDEYGIITKSTTTMADGTVYTEKYDYNHGLSGVTIEHYENDTLVRTEELELTGDDPLLLDTFEVLPHPTATAATTRSEDDILYYFDADGSPEGHSVLSYNRYDRLCLQKDYDANGDLLRTTSREFAQHTVSQSTLSGK